MRSTGIVPESDSRLSAAELTERLNAVDIVTDFSSADAVRRSLRIDRCAACLVNDGLECISK